MVNVNQLVDRTIGEYHIERLLGQSQLGAAYLARQRAQGRRAMVTTFNLPEGMSPQEHEQLGLHFAREGETLVRLSHTHILPVYAFGMQPEYLYLITAFAKEASLAQFLKRTSRFSPQQTLLILKQLAAGLDYVHSQGIIHGMLSLSNIIVSNELTARIAGFGLRTILEIHENTQRAAPLAHLSNERNTFLLSNAEYISPERVLGLPIDARADIYALGVMLFVLLSGTQPFRGAQPLDIALQRLQQPVPSLHTICPDVPKALDLVIGQAMERDPEKRPQHAGDVVTLFERVLQSLDPAWGVGNVTTSQLMLDPQTTLPPTINWFDEQVVPSGQWEPAPPAALGHLSTNASPDRAPSTGSNADLLGGTDPFAWWATTSSKPQNASPAPGTFPWSTPVRKTNARPRPGLQDRRRVVTLLVTGAAAAGVTITGISFAHFLQSIKQGQIASGNGSSTGLTTTTGGNNPPAGATQSTQTAQGTSTPSKSATAQPTSAKGTQASPTAQPTQGQQPTPTPKSQPTPTPTPGHTGTVIGSTSQATNSAKSFTNPADAIGSLLIRLANGNFVACERTCTHEGVPVNYDSGSQTLVCPAHGAVFDPQNGFAHVSGPGNGPLAKVSISVNGDGTVTTG